MKTLRSRLLRLAAALGGVALCWACNAPFIPVPPPGQTTTFTSALVADADGGQKTVWVAHGSPNKDAAFARVSVFDKNLGAGVIAEASADGSYTTAAFDGVLNDSVSISYEKPNGAFSSELCFLLTDQSVATPDGATSAPKCPE